MQCVAASHLRLLSCLFVCSGWFQVFVSSPGDRAPGVPDAPPPSPVCLQSDECSSLSGNGGALHEIKLLTACELHYPAAPRSVADQASGLRSFQDLGVSARRLAAWRLKEAGSAARDEAPPLPVLLFLLALTLSVVCVDVTPQVQRGSYTSL